MFRVASATGLVVLAFVFSAVSPEPATRFSTALGAALACALSVFWIHKIPLARNLGASLLCASALIYMFAGALGFQSNYRLVEGAFWGGLISPYLVISIQQQSLQYSDRPFGDRPYAYFPYGAGSSEAPDRAHPKFSSIVLLASLAGVIGAGLIYRNKLAGYLMWIPLMIVLGIGLAAHICVGTSSRDGLESVLPQIAWGALYAAALVLIWPIQSNEHRVRNG